MNVAVVPGKKKPPVTVTFALEFVGDKVSGVTAIRAGRTGDTVREAAGEVSPLGLRT